MQRIITFGDAGHVLVIFCIKEVEWGIVLDKTVYLSVCNKNGCAGPVYVIEKGDTLYSIAQRYHTRVRVLLDLNPFVDIYNLQPGDEICIPSEMVPGSPEFQPYVVKKGETIGSLLQKLSYTFEELARINKALANQKLTAGTILLLPKKGREDNL